MHGLHRIRCVRPKSTGDRTVLFGDRDVDAPILSFHPVTKLINILRYGSRKVSLGVIKGSGEGDGHRRGHGGNSNVILNTRNYRNSTVVDFNV